MVNGPGRNTPSSPTSEASSGSAGYQRSGIEALRQAQDGGSTVQTAAQGPVTTPGSNTNARSQRQEQDADFELPTTYSKYEAYLQRAQEGGSVNSKQLARDIENLKDLIRSRSDTKSMVGRNLSSYYEQLSDTKDPVIKAKIQESIARESAKYNLLKSEVSQASQLRNSLISLRNAYGEGVPKPVDTSYKAPKRDAQGYDPVTKTLKLQSGELLTGVSGYTLDKEGNLKEVSYAQGKKEITIGKSGEVVSIQEGGLYAYLPEGRVIDTGDMRQLDPLKSADYSKLKALGLDYAFDSQAKAASEWYAGEAEAQAQTLGAKAFASRIAEQMKGDATGYLVQVRETPEGYLLEATQGALSTPSYLKVLESGLSSQSGDYEFADYEKVGEGEYLIKQKPLKSSEYLSSKAFGSSPITNISIDMARAEPYVEFESGEAKAYSELSPIQKEAFDANYTGYLKSMEKDIQKQIQNQTSVYSSFGLTSSSLEGWQTTKPVQFVKEGGTWKLEGLPEAQKGASLFKMPEPMASGQELGALRNFGGKSFYETEIEKWEGIASKYPKGKPLSEVFSDVGKLTSSANPSTLFTEIPESQVKAMTIREGAALENIVKWAYPGSGLEMLNLASKKGILELAKIGHAANIGFTSIEQAIGWEFPNLFGANLGNLTPQSEGMAEQKLQLESRALEAEATAKFRSWYWGDYIAKGKSGDVLGALSSLSTTGPILFATGLAAWSIAGGAATAKIASVPITARTAQAAAPFAPLAKTFITSGIFGLAIEESALTLSAQDYRPLSRPGIEATKTFLASGTAGVVFGGLRSGLNPVLKIIPEGGLVEAGKRLTAASVAGFGGGSSYQTVKDVISGKPIDVDKAIQYGAVGAAFGATFEAASIGFEKGLIPKPGYGKVKADILYPTQRQTGYSGLYVEFRGKAYPLVGLKDYRPVIGTPSFKAEGITAYPAAKTPFETAVLKPAYSEYYRYLQDLTPDEQAYLQGEIWKYAQKAPDKNVIVEYIQPKEGGLGVASTRFEKGYPLMEYTYYSKDPTVLKMGLKDVIGQSELFQRTGAVEKITGLIQKEKANVIVYGSMPQKAFVGDAMKRTPHDIDIMTISKTPEAFAKQVVKELGPVYGKDIRISPEKSSLVEIRMKDGSWVHGFDIHSKFGDVAAALPDESVMSADYIGYGLGYKSPFITKEGYQIVSLAEQGARKWESAIRFKSFGPAPEAHRLKDVTDALMVTEFKATAQGRSDILAQLESFKATLPEGMVSSTPSGFAIIPSAPVYASSPMMAGFAIPGISAAIKPSSYSLAPAKISIPSLASSPKLSASARISTPSYSMKPGSYAVRSPGASPKISPKTYAPSSPKIPRYVPRSPQVRSPSARPSPTPSPPRYANYSPKPSPRPYSSPSGSPSRYLSPSSYPSGKPSPSGRYGYPYKFETSVRIPPQLIKPAPTRAPDIIRPMQISTRRFSPRIEGVRSLYADLFSVARAQREYGRATQPSLRKRPYVWKYERNLIGKVPTVEELEHPELQRSLLMRRLSPSRKKKKGRRL